MKPRSAPISLETGASRSRGRGRVRRTVVRLAGLCLAGLGLYSLAGFFGVPYLIERGLAQYWSSAAGRTAAVARIQFNPFTLVGEVAGLEVRDADQGAAFAADRIRVDIAAQSLTERRLVISSIVFEQPQIRLAAVTDLAVLARFAREQLVGRTRIERLDSTGGSFAAGADTPRAVGFPQFELSLTDFDSASAAAGEFSFTGETTAGAGVSLDGSLLTTLERADGRLQIEGLGLDGIASRLGGVIADADLRGQVTLTAGFSAQSLLSAPTLRLSAAKLELAALSSNPASQLSVAAAAIAADADLQFTLNNGGLDLSGRIEAEPAQLTFRDARATPPQSFVIDDAVLLTTADAAGLSLILGGRLQQAGNAALTVHVPAGPGERSISIEASAVPAAALSAYASAALGRGLAAGSADLSLGYKLEDSRADGSVQLTLRNLAFAPRVADAGDSDAALELAAALLEDITGVIDLDLRFAGNAETVRDAVADALQARIGTVTATPLDTLASLTAGPAQAIGSVPFLPGDAALGDRALASVAALGDALQARPRLGLRVFGGYDPTADRNALARQQIELHVQLATAGASLQARPAPVNFSSPRAQDILDEFAGERLPADRIAALAERFVCAGALADICERVYYEQVFNALVANEEIGATTLNRLGRFRAQSIIDALRQRGIADERIELVSGNSVVTTSFGIGLPVELTALDTAAQPVTGIE